MESIIILFWFILFILFGFNIINADEWVGDINNTQRLATIISLVFCQMSYLLYRTNRK